MSCQSCCLILICISLTRATKIHVDGSIDLSENIGFKYTPDIEYLRSLNNTLSPEVAAIIDNITKNTHKLLDSKHAGRHRFLEESKASTKRAFRRRFSTSESLEESEEKTAGKMFRKSFSTTKPMWVDVQALLESLQSIITPRIGSPEVHDQKAIKITSQKKVKNRKLKRTKAFITEKSYDPGIERITRPMDFNFNHNEKSDRKVKKDNNRKKIKRTKSNKNINKKKNINKEKNDNNTIKHRKKSTAPKDEGNKNDNNEDAYHNDERHSKRTTPLIYEPLLRTNDPVTSQVIDGPKLIEILERFGIIKTETTKLANLRMQTQISVENYYKPMPLDDNSRIRNRVHLVKSDNRLQNFTLNVFKQNVDVFDEIKSKMDDPKVKIKVDYLARSYRNKFGDYVKGNQHQKIVTRLGTQKVILNTIETSNHIMRRLLTFIIDDMKKKQALRDDTATVWKNLVENEEQQEYVQACQKFNICRSKYSLSSFIADFFTIFLEVDDKKLKQGMDAFTEVLKETNLDQIMDKKMKKCFHSNIDTLERAEPNVIRPVVWIFRNMLIMKNQPLVVQEKVPKHVVNQSVALLDVIDMLDEKIPSTEENLLEWNDLKNSLVQWANGQRHDIVEIMQAFVSMIVRKGVERMDHILSSACRDKLRVFLRDPE